MKTNIRLLTIPFSLLALGQLCTSEFVPVYIWGTQSTTDPVPALHKLSQSSFRDDIRLHLTNNPTILLFVEQSLSPEDFGQRDRLGNSPFNYLSKAKKTSKVNYLPYVQNPIKSIKHWSDDIYETSIEDLTDEFEIPDSKVIVIALNDAKENEQRFDLLKRHDSFIASVYERVLQKNENVVAFYTAHRASWTGSGEIQSRKSRSLFAVEEKETSFYFNDSNIVFYASNININNNNISTINFSTSKSEKNIILDGLSSAINFRLQFVSANGYWYLQHVTLGTESYNVSLYAPYKFSYACGNQMFGNGSNTVVFENFQVQPKYISSLNLKDGKFDDPYHCVGFTTIPIWSGLFVTFILMIIMTIGLAMMMDIKTMDRFDDAKGKTITINVSE
ncbi:hypothetical protein GWI33_003387 [Rhynchophorus ferrugineus]|uniref:V-type proton ATPase subunit S1 n=1 Tax=Rhynchophorus ferrugineus TaxID=354439 RepID=A0A834J099_RHYFE|nr:hypothetical protein GWI33_003387 [Rhynchophorus ferrugineus]